MSLLENCPDAVVFCFPTPEREVAARNRLYRPGRNLVLASGVFDAVAADPLGPVWLPTDSQQRVRLTDLRRDPPPEANER